MSTFLGMALTMGVMLGGLGVTAVVVNHTVGKDSFGVYVASFLGCVFLTLMATVGTAMAVFPGP